MKSKGKNLKISIITVVRNNPNVIRTLESILAQEIDCEIELIVIDGGSTDNTIQILESFRNWITHFISEPDNGIYDAMNKGLRLATGDIIGILNSDDVYYSNTSLKSIVEPFLANALLDAVYANLVMVKEDGSGNVFRKWLSRPFREGAFEYGWMPPHPTFYARRSVFQKFGNFNLAYRIAGDFEWMVRVVAKGKIKTLFLNQFIIKMQAGGASNGSVRNILKANLECLKACRENGLRPSLFFIPLKVGSKLLQIIN